MAVTILDWMLSVPSVRVSSQTSSRMKAIRRRDTEPELALRSYLRAWHLFYRVCPCGLPGRPDVANSKRRWAVFVHGCFWHGHRGCRLASVPKTNTQFWLGKFAANRERDRRKVRLLEERGFLVIEAWQCQLRDSKVLQRIRRQLSRR